MQLKYYITGRLKIKKYCKLSIKKEPDKFKNPDWQYISTDLIYK